LIYWFWHDRHSDAMIICLKFSPYAFNFNDKIIF